MGKISPAHRLASHNQIKTHKRFLAKLYTLSDAAAKKIIEESTTKEQNFLLRCYY